MFADIEDEFPFHHDTPDFFFPVAQADITECSTYAVVCRLKASPTFTITSSSGSFSHPDHPDVTIKVPKKAVPPKAKFPLELKVGRFSYYRGTQRQFSENICSEDDLSSRIFGTFVVKFLACLTLLGFSNI